MMGHSAKFFILVLTSIIILIDTYFGSECLEITPHHTTPHASNINKSFYVYLCIYMFLLLLRFHRSLSTVILNVTIHIIYFIKLLQLLSKRNNNLEITLTESDSYKLMVTPNL